MILQTIVDWYDDKKCTPLFIPEYNNNYKNTNNK